MRSKKFIKSKTTSVFIGILFLSIAAIVCILLFSYSASDPSFTNATDNNTKNILGIFGSYTADILLQIFGYSSILFVIFPFLWGIRCILIQEITLFWLRFICALSSIILLSSLLFKYKTTGVQFVSYGGAVGNIFSIYVSNFNKQYIFYGEIILFSVTFYIASNLKLKSIIKFIINICLYTYTNTKKLSIFLLPILTLIKFMLIKLFQKEENLSTIESYSNKVNVQKQPQNILPTKQETLISQDKGSFSIPPTHLLQSIKKVKANTCSEKALQIIAQNLIQVLNDFGIKGQIISCSPGPVVTLYEFEPAPGIKSSRIIGLSDDIARTMLATSTRISIISGKNSLGIELPNKEREVVYLRESLESLEYKQKYYKLPLILGKNIAGNTTIADLASMPHLLVAGTTGSGKSVAINTMILSLLFRYTPEECKFVMIDPKMLELSVYQGIPHLLTPVVTDPSKAIIALKWTVKEMENRYRLMSHLNVRNMEGYNQKIEEAIQKGINVTKKIQTGFDPETGKPIYETIEIEKKKLPFIIVIVDEMADLMLVAGKDIESSIQRLAQMARAAGIHIIMATQRPSVDVITGVIKANFPTRISFQVTSKIDSRTILGEMGAEQLLGKGDMLFMSGGNKIKRIHSPFVSDNEVEQVVKFLKSQGSPSYSLDITTESYESHSAVDGIKDDLYDQAVAIVLKERKASTSFLQRCFKIGYNRAASIIEQMEKEKIIGQPNHVGKREILVNNN